MPRQLNLYKAIKRRGLPVEYVPGWSTRGSEYFNPAAVLDHWTAGPRGSTSRPSLRIVVDGRPDLPGPLCNVYLDRAGTAVVVAAGRANHAGYGVWRGLTGNSRFLGVEAEAADNDDWTDAQREAYPLLNAALLDAIGQDDAALVAGHSEYALPAGRKVDINGYTTDRLRAQTQAILDGTVVAHPIKTTLEEIMPTLDSGDLATIRNLVREEVQRGLNLATITAYWVNPATGKQERIPLSRLLQNTHAAANAGAEAGGANAEALRQLEQLHVPGEEVA